MLPPVNCATPKCCNAYSGMYTTYYMYYTLYYLTSQITIETSIHFPS